MFWFLFYFSRRRFAWRCHSDEPSSSSFSSAHIRSIADTDDERDSWQHVARVRAVSWEINDKLDKLLTLLLYARVYYDPFLAAAAAAAQQDPNLRLQVRKFVWLKFF